MNSLSLLGVLAAELEGDVRVLITLQLRHRVTVLSRAGRRRRACVLSDAAEATRSSEPSALTMEILPGAPENCIKFSFKGVRCIY